MSKRAQESKTDEGLAVAKPRPMSLAPRTLLNAKKNSSIDWGAWNSLMNQKLDQSGARQSKDPTTHSQEWQQDDNPFRRGVMSVRVQEAQGNRCGVSITSLKGQRLECHNVKLNLSRDTQVLDLKNQRIDLGII